MNFRLLCCLALGLFTTYIGIFMLVNQLRAGPRRALPPRPNFSAHAATFTDPVTGEKAVYREITVSTKFVPAPATPPPEAPRLVAPAQEDSRFRDRP